MHAVAAPLLEVDRLAKQAGIAIGKREEGDQSQHEHPPRLIRDILPAGVRCERMVHRRLASL